MSESAKVLAISTLEDLRNQLKRFRTVADGTLSVTENEIQRTLEWLSERHVYWQRERERAERQLTEMRRTIESSTRSTGSDAKRRYRSQDSNRKDRELAEAERHLRICDDRLRKVHEWRSRFEQALTEHKKHSLRLRNLSTTHTERAVAFLEEKLAILEDYSKTTSAVRSGKEDQKRPSGIFDGIFGRIFAFILGLFIPPLFTLQLGNLTISLGITGLSIGIPVVESGGLELGIGVTLCPSIEQGLQVEPDINVSPAQSILPPVVIC